MENNQVASHQRYYLLHQAGIVKCSIWRVVYLIIMLLSLVVNPTMLFIIMVKNTAEFRKTNFVILTSCVCFSNMIISSLGVFVYFKHYSRQHSRWANKHQAEILAVFDNILPELDI